MTAEREQAFWHIQYDGFSPTGPEDDMLHPEQNAEREGDTLTETQYFGFGVPSERIHALCYMWHHPNLHVVFGGLFVWQGVKRNNFECEIFDFVTYQSDACLANDLWEYKLANGYHVTTLEPMRRHRARYEDGRRRNLVDVEFEAMMPAVRMKNAMHFEQGMKTKGRLVLGGREYEVDGYTVRDRSWGHLRSEEHKPYPPMAWMNCCSPPRTRRLSATPTRCIPRRARCGSLTPTALRTRCGRRCPRRPTGGLGRTSMPSTGRPAGSTTA
jgi:hypothetical protein